MYARHELIWLTPDGWQAAARGTPQQRLAIARWAAQDWPLVARRAEPGAGADQVCLGLALPPDPHSGEKIRIALQVSADGVARNAAPLPLRQVLEVLPASWQAAAAALADAALGLNLRAYGSAALQALTAQAYLRPSSDLDLLLSPVYYVQLRAGMALLQKYAPLLPLDGEIIFPQGHAVAWKEWLGTEASGARVLVKQADGVRLLDRQHLLDTLRQASGATCGAAT